MNKRCFKIDFNCMSGLIEAKEEMLLQIHMNCQYACLSKFFFLNRSKDPTDAKDSCMDLALHTMQWTSFNKSIIRKYIIDKEALQRA